MTTAQLRVGLHAFDLLTVDRDAGRAQLAQLAAAHGLDDARALLQRSKSARH